MLWMVLLFALQFVAIFFLIYWSSTVNFFYLALFLIISILLAFVIISRRENATYRLTWMFVLVVLPLVGGVLYILFANKKIGSLSEKKIKGFRNRMEDETDFSYNSVKNEEISSEDGEFKRQVEYLKNTTGLYPFKDTDVYYFKDTEEFFLDLLENIEKAKKFIFIEYFILDNGKWWNKILDKLKKKVLDGVDVRVVFDDMGSINVLPINYDKTLQSFGIKAIAFNKIKLHVNPRLNFRTHRKIFDIDGNIAYTGGVNLADEYANDVVKFGYWKDDAVRLHGYAVWNFSLMFLRNWDCITGDKDSLESYIPTEKGISDGIIFPFDDNPFGKANMAEDIYLQIINSAKRYVWITTPYLILDDTFESALKMAARSGVDIRIITPHVPDKRTVFEATRSNYEPLLEAGVKIYEYTPGFIHAKNFICDDKIAVVGTCNLDFRSFYLHFELCVLFHGSSITNKLKDNFEDTLLRCEEMKEGEEKELPLFRRLFRSLMRIFSPLI